jgi:hypothetical protein
LSQVQSDRERDTANEKSIFKKVAAEQLKEKKLALQERKRGRTIL